MENRGEKGIHMNSHLSNFDDQSALSQEVSQGLIFLTSKKESDYSHQCGEQIYGDKSLDNEAFVIMDNDEYFVDIPSNCSGSDIADILCKRIADGGLNYSADENLDCNYRTNIETSYCSETVGDFMNDPRHANQNMKGSMMHWRSSSSNVGSYGFNVKIEPAIKRRSADYILFAFLSSGFFCGKRYLQYSVERDYLYAKPFISIPFAILFHTETPTLSVLRIFARYVETAYASQPVHRCPLHLASDGVFFSICTREHFIVVDIPEAIHVSGQSSFPFPHVMITLSHPSVPFFIPVQFQCYSSCSGGINRRPLFLFFILEVNGELVGEQRMSLKVCAYPSRDCASDEQPTMKKRRKCISPVMEVVTQTHYDKAHRKSFEEDDETIYEIQVRGRHLYKLISSIIYNFELGKRYVKEKVSESRYMHSVYSNESLSPRMPISVWLKKINQSQCEDLFNSRAFFLLSDLEGKINKQFLASMGMDDKQISSILNSYLSWFNVYNAQRLSDLSSEGSSIRIQRTRIRNSFH
ncbi:unnamed protein product [Dracunculus medinensis]|uniref:P53 domain-containing protein n=1 Tax=Dracunculus medinensis TaxID=318479 RepID=A0A0N4UDB8_DRAME|nr:unnamed protein product [Dracunculus medinensis]